jgi:hypothetical protein
VLAAVDVLLHTRHKLLEIFFTDYLPLHQCNKKAMCAATATLLG